MRLSEKQRDFLRQVHAQATPTDDFPDGLPLYAGPSFMEFKFNTWAERRNWFANLQSRGLIVQHGPGGCFIRLTDAGRAAIA